MKVAEVGELGASVLAEVGRAVVGKPEPLELVLLGLLADGHVLIEDYPGLGKTLIARCFARVADLRFARVQFTSSCSSTPSRKRASRRAARSTWRSGPRSPWRGRRSSAVTGSASPRSGRRCAGWRRGGGVVQLARLVDALLESEIGFSHAWKDLRVIPRRVLPSGALVLALTPLLDGRTVTTLLDLRGRGFDLAIVEVSPLPFIRRPRARRPALAYRLWRLRREALRGRYARLGVPVVGWKEGDALDAILGEVNRFRRYARVASAGAWDSQPPR